MRMTHLRARHRRSNAVRVRSTRSRPRPERIRRHARRRHSLSGPPIGARSDSRAAAGSAPPDPAAGVEAGVELGQPAAAVRPRGGQLHRWCRPASSGPCRPRLRPVPSRPARHGRASRCSQGCEPLWPMLVNSEHSGRKWRTGCSGRSARGPSGPVGWEPGGEDPRPRLACGPRRRRGCPGPTSR